MISFVYSLVPDDWISAARAFRQMFRIAGKTPHAFVKHAIGIALPFFVGTLAGYPFISALSADFMQGYLTVIGVLAGFVITLMLFTGSGEGTDTLNHSEAVGYADKILYLLFSQTFTLCCYLVAIIIGAAWLFSFKATFAATHPAYRWIAPMVFGAGLLAIFRTVLLPGQIYERHEFVMAALLERKQREHNAMLRKAREEIAASHA